ncbi:MAG: tetratricopeptide repeat protein [bacterium]
MRKIYNFIIKYAVYALVFLMPLFFLPWTGELYEFNKQYLIFILGFLAILFWLIRMISVDKKFLFKRSPLDLWILIFAVITIFSASFSVDKISSWMGFYGRYSGSVIILLVMLLLYFLLTNTVGANDDKNKENISSGKIVNALLISGAVVIVTAYLSLFNVWSKIPGLPQIMQLKTFNTVGGSFEVLSVFLAVLISLVVGLLLAQSPKAQKMDKKSKFDSVARYLLLIFSLILLLIIDYSAAWIALGVTMFILLAVALWTRLFKDKVNVLLIPIVLLIISVVGITMNVRGVIINTAAVNETAQATFSQIPRELNLDYGLANQITWKAFKDNPLLGSGAGTFLINFSKFKPTKFNNHQFWNVRFDKAPNYILETIVATGIAGLLSYILMIGVFLLMIGVFFLSKRKLANLTAKYEMSDKRHPVSVLPLILAWLSLLVAQFVYLQNTVFLFYFWVFTALIVVSWQSMQDKGFKEVDFSFNKLPEVGLVMNVILMILAFGFISVFYLGGRFYWAEVKFNTPVTTADELIINSEKAVILNKYYSQYRVGLSQAYLTGAWVEAQKAEEEQNLQLLEAYARGVIQQAKFATQLAPNLVSNWENLGSVYRDSRGLVGGTLPLAIDAFFKASELEPINPFFYREICRLNILNESEDMDKTLEYCQRAVDLKPNYLDAHLQLALAYEKKGDLEEAVNKLNVALDSFRGVSFERGSELAGAAAEIYFQMGRVYFNLERYDEALTTFEQSVIIMPQHTNARYALALTYQMKDRVEDALIQFEIVSQLVPNNQEIQQIVSQLKNSLQPSVETEETEE